MLSPPSPLSPRPQRLPPSPKQQQLHQLAGNVGGLQQFQASIAGNAAKGLQATAFCSRQHSGTQNIAAGVQGNTAFTQANQAVSGNATNQNLNAAQSNNVLFNQNAGVNQFSTGAIGNNLAVNQGNTVAFQANTGSILGNVAALGQQNTVNALGNAATNQQNMFGIGSNIAGVQANGINAAGNVGVNNQLTGALAQSNGMNFVSNLGAVQGFQVDVSKNIVA
ncbi:hypothetical protein BC829DRAFT_409100 [Chytridium lagenaria]|nr:hypothetical protein BC829DRAFT_409100 [Chytridium lagenaria]